MVKRTRIGLLFSYSDKWIAGAYYIFNIIHALNSLEDKLKPHVVILAKNKSEFQIVLNETQYPYISYHPFPLRGNYLFMERVVNKIGRILLNKPLIVKAAVQPDIDFLYPYEEECIKIEGLKKVNWIPDFQEEHLPHLFSKDEIDRRKKQQQEVICKGDFVVFSSINAMNDFEKLYPSAKAKAFVLPFAVTHPNFSAESINLLIEKYSLPKHYFFAPNQFWAHKNHQIILEAVNRVKDIKSDIMVVFSGKEDDYRNTEYMNGLKKYIKENELEKNLKFLGFIDRREQLCIMANSIAVLQPSLFEGWSTVVEDAKSLGKHIILSNIDIHKEQINKEVTFFNPKNAEELSKILLSFNTKQSLDYKSDYKRNIKAFGEKLLSLIHLATK